MRISGASISCHVAGKQNEMSLLGLAIRIPRSFSRPLAANASTSAMNSLSLPHSSPVLLASKRPPSRSGHSLAARLRKERLPPTMAGLFALPPLSSHQPAPGDIDSHRRSFFGSAPRVHPHVACDALGRQSLRRGGGPFRRFHIAGPVCMGRRSSKIATRKGAQDMRKSKIYGKIGKQIVTAVRAGGASPGNNPALAFALAQARLYAVPKDVIERNMKKAGDKGQADYAEVTYEVYGVGGVGIVVDVMTDNNARSAALVRDVVKKGGGKMADPGSVMFNFNRCGVIAVPAEKIDSDSLLLAAMDAGAEDVLEPQSDRQDDEDEEEETPVPVRKVVTALDAFADVMQKLEKASVPILSDDSGLQYLPTAYVHTDEEARELNEAMIDKLLSLDDVDAVYCNQQS